MTRRLRSSGTCATPRVDSANEASSLKHRSIGGRSCLLPQPRVGVTARGDRREPIDDRSAFLAALGAAAARASRPCR